MRTVDGLAVGYAPPDQNRVKPRTGLFDRLEQNKLLVLAIAVAIGFCARAYRLDAAGIAEDESNKIFALRAYEQGDFTANAEHPMTMKLLCYASIHSSSVWNRVAGNKLNLTMSEETALRLPNAAFGALTVIPLLLLTTGLLGFRVGFITALLWALGLDAIWFNRTAKEDTLLVFFMLSGFYLYFKAKHSVGVQASLPASSAANLSRQGWLHSQVPAADVRRQERVYALAGAAFGLMMASKYFPQYFALNALFYTLVGYDSRNNRPLTRTMWMKYFAALMLTFVVFNPAAFFPQTWRYLWKYVNEELVTHHGYLVMDKLFINDVTHTPNGNPWYFYFLFLAVKVPLPVLVAFVAGLVEIFRRRAFYPHSRGYLFLRMMVLLWLIPEALVGTKFLRYSLSLMPFLYMTAAVGIILIWQALSTVIHKIAGTGYIARVTAAVAVAAIFVVSPAVGTISCMIHSYPSLYLNVFGANRIGYFFPHDEYYDLGARESIRFIAETAPPGAMMASEIPGVVQYYLEKFGRPDIRSQIISQPRFTLAEDRPDFVLLQPGRVYIENLENFRFIERNFPVAQSSVYEGAAATRVYSMRSK